MYTLSTGYFYTFLSPNTREYFENDIFSMILINFTMISSILFIKEFLYTKQYPYINKTLNILLTIISLAIPLLSIPSLFYLLEYDILICYISMFFFLFIGFYTIYKKHPFGVYYTIGFSLSILAVIVYTSHYLAIYPFLDEFPYLVEVLYIFEGFLFSYVLSKRFRIVQNQNKQLQNLQKELNHRVKNNMQIILSIINIQTRKIKDQNTKKEILEIKNRIFAMGKIHDLLYNSSNFSIDAKEYFSKLFTNIFEIFKHDFNVTYDINCDEQFELKNANDIALILNELLFNCFKYAFKNNKGHISVQLKQNQTYQTIILKDDGVGITNKRRDDSLGLTLVKDIVEQKLNGSIQIISSNGTEITIKIKR